LELVNMSPIEVNKNFPDFGIGRSSVSGSHSTNRSLWMRYAV